MISFCAIERGMERTGEADSRAERVHQSEQLLRAMREDRWSACSIANKHRAEPLIEEERWKMRRDD
jgi:hypothetical protein